MNILYTQGVFDFDLNPTVLQVYSTMYKNKNLRRYLPDRARRLQNVPGYDDLAEPLKIITAANLKERGVPGREVDMIWRLLYLKYYEMYDPQKPVPDKRLHNYRLGSKKIYSVETRIVSDNPYDNLSGELLRVVMSTRKIVLPHMNNETKRKVLALIDENEKDWVNAVEGKINTETKLTEGEYHYMAAKRGLRLYMVYPESLIALALQLQKYRAGSLEQENVSVMHKKIERLSWVKLILLVEMLYTQPLPHILQTEKELKVFLLNPETVNQYLAGRLERYKKIVALAAADRSYLIDYHNFTNDRIGLVVLAVNPPKVFDAIILDPNADVTALIAHIGIIIPPETYNVRGYIMRYLDLYDKVANRPQGLNPPQRNDVTTINRNNLKFMSDTEIFQSLGIEVPFTDRMALVEGVRELWYNPGFFISTARHCKNKETLLLSDVADPDITLIGYGFMDNYHGYELAELNAAFSGGDTDIVKFKRPDDPHITFTAKEIITLAALLTYLKEKGQGEPQLLDSILNKIRDGLILIDNLSQVISNMQKLIITLSSAKKENIKVLLKAIFEVGMYMRRWQGPGHLYPLKYENTRKGDNPALIDDDAMEDSPLAKAIAIYYKATNNVSTQIFEMIKNLPIVHYDSTTARYSDSEENLYHHFIGAINRDECIRMASKDIVVSSAYYLYLFFKYDITNYRVQDMANIS